MSHQWPNEEKYEIGLPIRRFSNSSPAQLAEKNHDRHFRNKIEGVNRSRGEAAEPYTTPPVHAREKSYITAEMYGFRARYKEYIRMLNGLEKTLETKLPEGERRWVAETVPRAIGSIANISILAAPLCPTPET